MATLELKIPDYFTVDHFQRYQKYTSFEPIDQMIAVVGLLTNHSEEEIRDWPVTGVTAAYKAVLEMIKSTEPKFYPVVEWNGALYGFRPVSKMSLAEYIDLDSLAKNTNDNLTEILALLYRPVTENKLGTGKFTSKSFIKAWAGEIEDPFNYYDIQKYDSNERKVQSQSFKDFPVSVALGALTFFLGSGLSLFQDLKTSIPGLEINPLMTEKKKMTARRRLHSITDGYIRSRLWETPPSFTSPETNPS